MKIKEKYLYGEAYTILQCYSYAYIIVWFGILGGKKEICLREFIQQLFANERVFMITFFRCDVNTAPTMRPLTKKKENVNLCNNKFPFGLKNCTRFSLNILKTSKPQIDFTKKET